MRNHRNALKRYINIAILPILSLLTVLFASVLLLSNNLDPPSQENFLYLTLALSLFLSLLNCESRDRSDNFLLFAIAIIIISGPTKFILKKHLSDVSYFLAFHILDLSVILALFEYCFSLLKSVSKFDRITAVRIITLVTITSLKIGGMLFVLAAPIQWLVKYDEDKNVIFSFFRLEFFSNQYIQAILGIGLLAIIIYFELIKERVFSLHLRHLLIPGGLLVFFLLKLVRVIAMYEEIWSSWIHSLVEICGLIPLLIWFIASRVSNEKADQKQERNIVWGIQLSLLTPFLYFEFVNPHQISLLISLSLICFLEIVFVLFYFLTTLSRRLIAQGKFVRTIGDYLVQVWNKPAYGFIVTSEDGWILDMSKDFMQNCGDRCIGSHIEDFLALDLNDKTRNYDELINKQAWLKRNTGEKQPIMLTTKRLWSVHRQVFLSIVSDIEREVNDTKYYEDLQKETLNRLTLNSLAQMSKDVSHNMNNFLASMSGITELVAINVNSPEEVNRLVDKMRFNIATATRFVKQISAQNLTDDYYASKANINQALKEAIKSIRKSFSSSEIDLSVTTPDEILFGRGDQDSISHVFYQIIRNSFEAIGAKGKLSVTIQIVDFPEFPDPPHNLGSGVFVQIDFTDSGPGVKKEDVPYIFNPFYSTSNQVGKGLGLTAAHAIIQAHKGTLDFRNEIDGGTTFTVIIPSLNQVIPELRS